MRRRNAIRRGGGGGASQSAAATAYFAAMSVQPDAARKALINTLIAGLEGDGVWAKLDWLSLFAVGTAQAALLNAVNPAQTFSVVNTPTFVADRGYTGVNSSLSYLNSNWDVSTNGVNYTQNSCHQTCWITGNTAADIYELGYFDTGGLRFAALNPRFTTDAILVTPQCTGTTFNSGAASVTTSTGFSAWDRSGANDVQIFKNGVSLASSGANVSAAASTRDFFALTHNANNGYPGTIDDTRQMNACSWGGHLTDAEQLALYNRLSTYLVAVGAA